MGIGTTSPAYKFSVEGIGSFGDYARASYFVATSTTATSTFAGGINVAGTPGLTVLQNGNVGIGTISPSSLLTIQSSASTESAPLGAELTSSSGWTSTGWTGNYGAGFTHTPGNTSTLSNSTAVTAGAYYILSFTITGATAGLVTPSLGGVTAVPDGGDIMLGTAPKNGTYFYGPYTTATTGVSFAVTSTFDGVISNISIKQVTGPYAATYAMKSADGTADFEIRSSPNTSGPNTFIGVGSGAKNTAYTYMNTAVGAFAMASNISGVENTCVGYSCLNLNATGNFNTSMGHSSMAANVTGYDNAFFGDVSATNNTTGKANSGFGNAVMLANTTGSNNSAFGNHALASNTTGTINEAFGDHSLYTNTTGVRNSAFGNNTLSANVAGTDNAAFGDSALAVWNSATSGYNSAFGSNTLALSTTATNNSAFGGQAGQSITSGSNNSLLGNYAGGAMTTAKNSVIIGHNAAPALTTGWYNTIVGGDSASILTGQFNTFLGYGATSNTANVNQSVAIGYTAVVTASNQIMLGTVSETVVAPNKIGIGTTSPFAILSVSNSVSTPAGTTLFAVASTTGGTSTTTVFSIANTGDVTIKGSSGSTCTIGNGVTGTSCSSDERLKTNIALIVDPLQSIEQIRGVTFNWVDPAKSQTQFIGVIAQDVQKVFPQVVSTTADGYLAVDYAALVAPLIEAVKELAGKVDSLAATVAGFANEIITNRVDTKTLCVDGTCITGSQLKTLLQNSGGSGGSSTTQTNTQTATSTITVSQSANGSISPDTQFDIASSTNVSFTITPDTGFDVASLLIDSQPVATSTSYTFANVTTNHTITATFAAPIIITNVL